MKIHLEEVSHSVLTFSTDCSVITDRHTPKFTFDKGDNSAMIQDCKSVNWHNFLNTEGNNVNSQ